VKRYLLDTNIVSDLVRNPQGIVAARIRRVGEANVATSVIVAAELRFGAGKNGSRRLTDQVTAVLDALEVIPFEPPADITYARIRAALEKAGRPIGANDLLIAAQAVTLSATLVTDNEHEFQRVRALTTINWLRA
jgi:tRNA(fMet)-specific endonuclease VapC